MSKKNSKAPLIGVVAAFGLAAAVTAGFMGQAEKAAQEQAQEQARKAQQAPPFSLPACPLCVIFRPH